MSAHNPVHTSSSLGLSLEIRLRVEKHYSGEGAYEEMALKGNIT